ncbi:MAG: HD domain-containing phosphohydrolase [Candidatus Omnitrophota bacterium]
MEKTSKNIDYKKALEAASRGMIMIHDPQVLIKMILRIIVGRVQIKHAGMILHDPDKDAYVLNVTKGKIGNKVPEGFVRFYKNSPLIQVFFNKKFEPLLRENGAIVSYDLHTTIWKEGLLNGGVCDPEVSGILHGVCDEMDLYEVVACVPAIYHRELMAILMLGPKIDGKKFERDELTFFAALASNAAMAIRNAQLFEKLKENAEKKHDLFIRMTNTLGAAIEAKDEYTKGHSEGVTRCSVAIARYMSDTMNYEFDEQFFENLYIAGILHDIGKIGVPEMILNKPGRLTPEEYALIKRHPVDGVSILKDLPELEESIKGIRHHHERYDGGGYPDGLKGEEIPIIAAIIAVADTFDAMTTQRPYRPPSTPKDTVEEIMRHSGTQFHPDAAKALRGLFEKKMI